VGNYYWNGSGWAWDGPSTTTGGFSTGFSGATDGAFSAIGSGITVQGTRSGPTVQGTPFNCGSGTCSFAWYPWQGGGAQGVSFHLLTAGNGNGAWIQTFSKNGSPWALDYNPTAAGAQLPYYGFPGLQGLGAQSFFDSPGAPGAIGYFGAETSFVVPNGTGGVTPLFTIGWGYTSV
jgi:hypothetical protein